MRIMIFIIEDNQERYRKIKSFGYEDPVIEHGWIKVECQGEVDFNPINRLPVEWLGGIRYDSEKKAIVQWEEEPISELPDEFQVMKDKLIKLENRITELETNISSTTIKMTRGTSNG